MHRKIKLQMVKNEKRRLEIEFRDYLEAKITGMDMPDRCKDLCFRMCVEAHRNGMDDLGQIWLEKER